MSFYAIIDTKYFDESFLDPDIGIFNEDGIKEAKKLLYVECYKRVSCEYESGGTEYAFRYAKIF